ncbi:hypothetical protein Bpfe_007998, partial [Biomphalaria pfeifferi]
RFHNWSSLPLLVFMNIFEFITDKDIRNLALVCQRWYLSFQILYNCQVLRLNLMEMNNDSMCRIENYISSRLQELSLSYD